MNRMRGDDSFPLVVDVPSSPAERTLQLAETAAELLCLASAACVETATDLRVNSCRPESGGVILP